MISESCWTRRRCEASRGRSADGGASPSHQIELQEIWKLTPENLELYYQAWEKKWHADGGKDINNPKVPLLYVRKVGELIYRAPDVTVMSPELRLRT